MSSVLISCSSCEFHIKRSGSSSFYEQQATESLPCPKCGACTLRCTVTSSLSKRLQLRLKRQTGVMVPEMV